MNYEIIGTGSKGNCVIIEKALSSKVLRETLEQRYDVKVVETTHKGVKYRLYIIRN